jgi:2-phospho-L-lactate guanylyltransferase
MSHMTGSAPHGGWQVVVPVKALDRAKSRLSTRTAGARRSLALAFALDTVAAAIACDEVERVLVVGDDEVRDAVTVLGAEWVPDPGDGLNPAVAAGAAAAGAGGPVAALVGDLPALRPEELGLALSLAEAVERGLVADSAGIGTTLLTRRDGGDLDPRFGVRSRAAHRASGAVELAGPPGALAGLRRDVDTEVELWDARRLGVGPATAAELALD